MADNKFINTRIMQKIDSAKDWWNNNPTLALGEIAIVLMNEIATEDSEALALQKAGAPEILMKIGNGKSTYRALPWLSGLSADISAQEVNTIKKKLTEVVLTSENGILNSDQLEAIKSSSTVKIIINDLIYSLTIKDTKANKYIYCATEVVSDKIYDNVHYKLVKNKNLELNLATGAYTVSTTTSEINEVIEKHISDTDVHIQTGEREFWNTKVNCETKAIEGTVNDNVVEFFTENRK